MFKLVSTDIKLVQETCTISLYNSFIKQTRNLKKFPFLKYNFCVWFAFYIVSTISVSHNSLYKLCYVCIFRCIFFCAGHIFNVRHPIHLTNSRLFHVETLRRRHYFLNGTVLRCRCTPFCMHLHRDKSRPQGQSTRWGDPLPARPRIVEVITYECTLLKRQSTIFWPRTRIILINQKYYSPGDFEWAAIFCCCIVK